MRNLSRSAPLTGGGTISGDLTVTGDMVVEGGGALSVDQLLEGDFKILTASATAFVVGDISEPANDIFTVDTSTPEITAGAPIVFSSLGEATRAIDLSSSGLHGSNDYYLYFNADNYWCADAAFRTQYISVANLGGNKVRITPPPSNTSLLFEPSGYGNLISKVVSNSAQLFGTEDFLGSLTNCTSNGTATITKTSHGLSVAAGDLIHITDATTAADEGFYRLVSSAENTLVVDRALSGSDADVDLTVYKDVIGIFATDGTNGQRIMSYSHQDKPLQIGGDVLAATGHSLGAEDVLIDGNKLEINPDVYFDGDIDHNGTNIGFLGATPQAQQAHIVDADGTLADITTKFNTLLADLEGYGFLATS